MARIPVPAVRSNLGAGGGFLMDFLEATRAFFERRRSQGTKPKKGDDSDQSEESRKGVRDSSAPSPPPTLGLGSIIAEQDREFRRKRPGFLKPQVRRSPEKSSKPAPTKAKTQQGVGAKRSPPPRPVNPRIAAYNNVVGRLFSDPGTRDTFFDPKGSLRTGLLTPDAMSIVGGQEETFEKVIERFTRVEQIRENPRLSFQRLPTSTFVRPSVNALFGGGAQPSIDPLLNIGFSDAASSGLGF